MIVAFTGHRPDKLGGYAPNELRTRVCRAMTDKLLELAPERVITGMALGVDQWAAEICIELEIPYVAAVPHEGQSSRWPWDSRERYDFLISRAESVQLVNRGPYSPSKMQARNVWMVDNCEFLIAVWDGSGGGTANAVRYAEKIGRQLFKIHPRFL